MPRRSMEAGAARPFTGRIALATLALIAAGCAGAHGVVPGVVRSTSTSTPTSTSTSTATTTTTIVGPHVSIVAQAVGPSLAVYTLPGDASPSRRLASPRPLGGPQVLLVIGRVIDWLHVALPVRPNGTTGWIRQADVTLSQHNYRIVVEEHAHRITFYKGDTVIDQEPIAIGTQATPTPGGLFYTVDFVKLDNPNGPYGPYAFGLSGYSDVLTSFAGGPGQLAIHGTNEPWVLGHDASHGCIRLSNAGITRVAQVLPLGVPVTVLG